MSAQIPTTNDRIEMSQILEPVYDFEKTYSHLDEAKDEKEPTFDLFFIKLDKSWACPNKPLNPKRAKRTFKVKQSDIQSCKDVYSFRKLRRRITKQDCFSTLYGFSELEKINWGLSQHLIIDILKANDLPKSGRQNIAKIFHNHICDARSWVKKSYCADVNVKLSALRLLTSLDLFPISKIRL
ncbi:MAG: hypothetical protein WD595_05445 [Waddliaceae bacterium]